MTYQLEEPFFEEKGRITSQKEFGGGETQMTFSSNGPLQEQNLFTVLGAGD